MTKLIIPMAGDGTRFAKAGYEKPKPFINTKLNQTLIEIVLSNLTKDYDFDEIILICKKEHEQYLGSLKEKNLNFVFVDKTTEGAACTILHAIDFINCEDDIVIANSDQYIHKFNIKEYIDSSKNFNGSIVLFQDNNPKWSFAKIVNNLIVEVAEKKPISNNATVGIYYFKSGREMVNAFVKMIAQNDRTNNEFYTCPAFNYLKGEIMPFFIEKSQMFGLGTPEDLKIFEETQL